MDEVKLLPCGQCVEVVQRLIEAGLLHFTDEGWTFDPKIWDAPRISTLVTDEVVERVAKAIFEDSVYASIRWETTSEHFKKQFRKPARAALAVMPAIPPQSLGAIPGSHPADQAHSGLGASRFDPERG